MMHPYDVAYLQEIAETQGALFERLQDEQPTVDGLDFIRSYMKSETRAFIDKGDVYLATLDAGRLMAYYRDVDKQPLKGGAPLRGFMPNWIGQFYANYQWHTGTPSRELVDRIPPDWLATAYPGLHDLDMKLAVEKVRAGLCRMSDLRLNNTIFLMHAVTNAYARRHGLSREGFLSFDDKYHVLRLVARCPDVFDPMTEDEMVEKIDAYVSQSA